ncbi:YbaB/EbfC family nucleoid-associated protein [Nocardia sp. NPDC051570]|uniref:YbaB/EbfC family nucleoid-associated protein n=1 Tax=Nocardia sp. NPDC051570 TaxID=3364324 RepID=UPI0037AA3075
MSNEQLKNDMATVLEGLRAQLGDITEAHRKRAELTATAELHDGRVVVTVDADGILTDVEFSDEIDDLSDDEIAAAVTMATQQAAQEAARRMREMMQPMVDRRARWPKLSDLLAGAVDFQDHIPGDSRAPSSPPDSPDRDPNAAPVDMSRSARSIVSDDDHRH